MNTSQPSNAWYREPWPWFLMTGPLLAMLGCIITIYLAVTRFDDQPITAGAVKRGLVVERVEGGAPAAEPAAGPASTRP
ncbi:hypothetical protein [Bordetella petrii]|uniref:hypothetical protein n=1 Tax=Bordetella petrii TaxID=94624 RepID=UPI003734290E